MSKLVAELDACLATAEKAAVRFAGPELDSAVRRMGEAVAALAQPGSDYKLDAASLAAIQAKLVSFRDLCGGLKQGLHKALLGGAESTRNSTYAHLAAKDAKEQPGSKTTYPFVRRYG